MPEVSKKGAFPTFEDAIINKPILAPHYSIPIDSAQKQQPCDSQAYPAKKLTFSIVYFKYCIIIAKKDISIESQGMLDQQGESIETSGVRAVIDVWQSA